MNRPILNKLLHLIYSNKKVAEAMEDKILLSVLGFSFNQDRTGAYGLVLAEQDGLRRLMVVIGTPEAQSIAFNLQHTRPPRPLTHDIFNDLIVNFDIKLMEVVIYKYEKGVFYSQLVFAQGDKTINIESRTSDAVGLALRAQSPIYTTENIMKELGVVLDDSVPSDSKFDENSEKIHPDYSLLNQKELESLLEDAVKIEDYELASLLRDELNKRK